MATPETPGIPADTVIGGRYTVESLLGRGGMATVYRATDVPLGRSVALKIFAIDTEGAAGLGRESSEIQLLASLNHHALVTLFDANIDGGDGGERSYLVMELVEGPTLKERIEAGPIAEIDVAQMLIDLGEALHVVHAGGVVHRDVKPANILLNPSVLRAVEFRAKLSDFGIAYLIDSTRLTMPGTVIGTAAYLSPEQARGAAPGPAADVYSLGLVALEALTGERAFEGTLIESISARLVSDPAIPKHLAPSWVTLFARMTDREPTRRPTALEVVEQARSIERELYAEGVASHTESEADADATAAQSSTAAMDVTAPLGATEAMGATAPLTAPTRVLPAADRDDATSVLAASSNDEATTVLPTADPPSGQPRSRPALPRRVLLAVAGVLAAAVVGAVVWGAVASGGGTPDSEPTPLPSNTGVLGTHLDELLESVTP
jgi:hypothetical protein